MKTGLHSGVVAALTAALLFGASAPAGQSAADAHQPLVAGCAALPRLGRWTVGPAPHPHPPDAHHQHSH